MVAREICSILSPGVSGHGVVDKIYNQKDHRVLCSIVEEPLKLNLEEDNLFMNEEEIGKKMVEGGNTDAVVIGLCIVDTVTGKFYLGQFVDDDQRTGLRTQLLRFDPTEFVVHRKKLLPYTLQLIHQECPLALLSYVDPASVCSPDTLVSLVNQNHLFGADDAAELKGTWPDLLKQMMLDGKRVDTQYKNCFESLCLSVQYLHRACVATILMSQRLFSLIDNIDEGSIGLPF